ncbi:MAG TPA: hypothetical protein VK894_02420 [Jiangellales bacterium]|nr:hypothetical protein [Jiangellales bacterium]
MSNDKAAEAREGLLASVAGKAKEVAGAVTGKDDLVEEGQLQQAEAKNRKQAVADEAVADAKREEALHAIRAADRNAARQQNAAHVQAQQEEADVERERASEHAVAAREAGRGEAAGVEAAEEKAEALAESRLREAAGLAKEAISTEQESVAEKRRLEREAAAAQQRAAQLRAETGK